MLLLPRSCEPAESFSSLSPPPPPPPPLSLRRYTLLLLRVYIHAREYASTGAFGEEHADFSEFFKKREVGWAKDVENVYAVPRGTLLFRI